MRLLSMVWTHKDYFTKEDYQECDLIFYQLPDVEKLSSKGIDRFYYYSYFHKWIPQENYYYTAEHTNFEANPETF